MRFTNVFSPYYRLMDELCKREWGFQVIYNDDDKNDPRIEFVYRNELAVVRNIDDAKMWLNVLNEYEPIITNKRQAQKVYKKLCTELEELNND